MAKRVCESYGDAWIWMAFVPGWRMVLVFVVGKRTQANANLLIGARIDFRAELARLHSHAGVAMDRLDYAGHARADRRGRGGTDDSFRGDSAGSRTTFELHRHHLVHGLHIVVQMRHDPQRTGEDQQDDQHAEGKRHDIVDVVWSRS